MKVLIATGLYPPEGGGPATNTRLLEDVLPKHGHTVEVLPFRNVRHLPRGLRHFAYFFRLKKMARRADYMYAQDAVSVGLPAALVAQWLGIPLIVRIPGDYAWEQGRQRFGVKDSLDEFGPHLYGWRVRLLHRIQVFTLSRARRVIAPSVYLRDHIISWGVEPEKVVLIYNGITLPLPVEEPSSKPGGFLVVSVGRMVPWKGMDGIISAIAKEPSWQAVLVGEGPERNALEAQARTLQCESRITFMGNLDRAETLGWVKVADVFTLNSTYEGLSHQLLEAMALGKSIVATRIGGNPELITDNVHGLLVEAENDESLYKALKRVEENPAEANAWAAEAAKRAEEFSIERTVRALIALLQEIKK